ncbi:ROK family protein, partial [Edaphobacter sp. HDX4]
MAHAKHPIEDLSCDRPPCGDGERRQRLRLVEVWFGDSDGLNDLVVVNVSEGIGTGIFSNGRLLRGSNGMAGE